MDVTQVLIIIPSRYDSTRLPAKALADICGKTLIQRTYEQCKKVLTYPKVMYIRDDFIHDT